MSSNPFIVETALEIALPKELLNAVAQRFGPQKARECAMSTSVGGIGPLLKDRILSQSEQGIDLIGVTLLYENVWVQTWHEWGQLNLQKTNVGNALRAILHPTNLAFELTGFDGTLWKIDVWEWTYHKHPVYFLSSPKLTDIVYPGPKDAPLHQAAPFEWSHDRRLRQSWILGRGTLSLTKKLEKSPSVILMSETPTIFCHHKLVKDVFQIDPHFAATKYIFNDHTPLEYAHPIWDKSTLTMTKMDEDIYSKSPGWNPAKKNLDITSLLVGICEGVFGVAKKHGDVMRAMQSLKKYEAKIEYITNGVKKEEWQAPSLTNWKNMTDENLLAEKQKLKRQLLDWLWRQCRLWPQWVDKSIDKQIAVLTRRITPYKRLDVLNGVLMNPSYRERFLKTDIVVVCGGRIHQQDDSAQNMVYALLDTVEKDPRLRDHVVFVDNFNIWEAPLLYMGANASIMMADDTREASATGFMKAQMNGAAVIATSDGAIPEFVFFDEGNEGHDVNGFFIPYRQGEPTTLGLLEAFEAFAETFKNRTAAAKMMRAALTMTDGLDILRTVHQMEKLYDRVLI